MIYLGNKSQHHSEIKKERKNLENPSYPETWSFIKATLAASEPSITSHGENAA